MKAAYLTKLGQPLSISPNVEIPELLPGQVLVKIAYSGVCHSQIMEAKGHRGPDAFLPHMLGHEASGIVQTIGAGVNKVAPGDRVVLGWIKGHGCNAPGAKYRCGEKVIQSGGVTTFMESAVVSENRCVKLPDGVPLKAAVLFGCALPTGAGIVLNTVKPAPGSKIAIWGLGGIGLSALLATRLYECAQVIAIDIEDKKLELAREFGATHFINSSSGNVLEQIEKITGGNWLDACVEASGSARVIELAFQAVRRGGGLCVFASHPAHGEKISLDPFELICGKRIMGSWGGDCQPDRDVLRFAELYKRGLLPLERMLSEPYALDEINQAMEDLENRKIARALIAIHPELDGDL